jgi:hypothetical protein
MAQGAIVFRWGAAVRGREQQALEVFGESVAYFDDLVKNHRISSHHPYVSATRNGGMWVIQGETESLEAIENEDDFLRLTARVQMIVDDYEREHCYGGTADDLAEVMGMFAEVIQQFS